VQYLCHNVAESPAGMASTSGEGIRRGCVVEKNHCLFLTSGYIFLDASVFCRVQDGWKYHFGQLVNI
jgi:hypothetical protein